MTRIGTPVGARLVYVESRGWLLGKLGIVVLVMAGVALVWGPLVLRRPDAMTLAGWLGWIAIAFIVVGAIVRVAEAVWGTACTAYVVIRSVMSVCGSIASTVGRAGRWLAPRLGQPIAVITIMLMATSSAWAFAAVVLDPSNLVQNTISALKAVESVINEVQMLANQV
jgi:hypothetical protein